jgi:hypothetical protein
MKIILLLVSVTLLGACSNLGKRVAAYDRQTLSETGMEFIENAVEEASMQHMFNAREGSVGGFGGAGGGCGCN